MRSLLPIILLFLSAVVIGQNNYPYTEIGVKGGLTSNLISYSHSINLTNLTGSTYGLVFKHVHEKFLGIQVEFNLTDKGSFEYGGDRAFPEEFLYTHKRVMNYYELPILSHFNFNIGPITSFLNVGPYVAYQRSYEIQTDLTSDHLYYNDFYHSIEAPYKFDNGLIFGAGVNLPTRYGTIQIEGRFSNGFFDIYDLNNNSYYERAVHQNLQIAASYLVSFNRFKKKEKDILETIE